MVAAASACGASAIPIDLARGGPDHDLRRPEVQQRILSWVAAHRISAAHLAPPCRSFSPLNHELHLRSRDDPWGRAAPPSFRAYIEGDNQILLFCVRVAEALLSQRRPVTIENPPVWSDDGTPWYWPAMAHLASLWLLPDVLTLADHHGLIRVTAAMCQFGSPYMKYFSLLGSPSLTPDILSLQGRWCPRTGSHRYHAPASGVDSHGLPRAAAAGQYPPELCTFLARALLCPTSSCSSRAGFAATGATLDPEVAAAVLAARLLPPAFASLRNRAPSSPEQLVATPLPDVQAMAAALARASAHEARLPEGRIQWDGATDWRSLVSNAPPGPISLVMLMGDEHLARWQTYVRATQLAFDAVRQGQPPRPPGSFLLRVTDLPSWAQPFVWDTAQPTDCQPVTRSNHATVFPGERQICRDHFQRAARELNWHLIDPDIVDQVSGGGVELRATALAHLTAVWHHRGVVEHFDVADTEVRYERQHAWTRVSQSCLPFIPCIFSPRDVILQERARLVNGSLELIIKPRVTHDMSSTPRQHDGAPPISSINEAVPSDSKALVGLPQVLDYSRAAAVCAQAGAGVGVYGVDKSKAYCFCPVQRADHYAGCYLWPDDDGVVRPHVSMRMVFGGSPWPNRFERIALLGCAWVQRHQRAFDAAHPPPSCVHEWSARRAALQRDGRLPAASRQCWPAGLEPFIDDLSGRASLDPVPLPDELRHLPIGAAQTRALGVSPAADDSRVAVHCRLAIRELTWLGWEIPEDKTMCGGGMILLGAQLDAEAGCVRCPAVKREWLLFAARQLRQHMQENTPIPRRLLERLTGRLNHLSQFFPELRLPLAVGYALTRGGQSHHLRRDHEIRLRPRGRRARELHLLLDVACMVAQDARGVPLAPAPHFDSPASPGVLVVITDASRAASDDGFGGYGFLSGASNVLYWMSEAWPPRIKAQLDSAAARRLDRASRAGLSMPAAEVFAAVALVSAVGLATSQPLTAVIAVVDCQPAAFAFTAGYSRSLQIRALLAHARNTAPRWLGVQVCREWNTDADLLSHPSTAPGVIASAARAGLICSRVRPSETDFAALVSASTLPLGKDDEDA